MNAGLTYSSNRRYSLAILLAAALSLIVPEARGDTLPIVLSGQVAPGTGGARFTSLSRAVVNSAGAIVFRGDFEGVNEGSGVFKVVEGALTPIVLTGEPIPDSPGASFRLIGDVGMNNAGDVAFNGYMTVSSRAVPAVFGGAGGTIRKIADAEMAAPGFPGQKFSFFSSVQIDDVGNVAFFARFPSGSISSAVYLFSNGNLRPIIFSTTTGSSPTFNTLPDFSMNGRGDIVLSTSTGIGVWSKGALNFVTLVGQPVPNSSIVMNAVGSPCINDSGEVVFLAGTVFPATGPGSSGGFRPDAVVRWRAGQVEKVAVNNDAFAPIPGALISGNLLHPTITNSGAVVFTGWLRLPGEPVTDTLFIWKSGTLSALTREGQSIDNIGTISILGEAESNEPEKLVTFVSQINANSFLGLFAALPGRFTLMFPQVADGGGSNGGWRTTFMIANRSAATATATVNFYDDAGLPMTVSINGQLQSQVSLSVPAQGVAQLQTEGTGVLKAGWAAVLADQNLSGIAIFGSSDNLGAFAGEVGVPASVPLRSMSVFVEAGPSTATGVALANPNTLPADVTLILRDSNSTEVARTSFTIPAMGHMSKYVSELFGAAPVRGTFEGKFDLLSGQPLVALTLRQRAAVFTSLPIIP